MRLTAAAADFHAGTRHPVHLRLRTGPSSSVRRRVQSSRVLAPTCVRSLRSVEPAPSSCAALPGSVGNTPSVELHLRRRYTVIAQSLPNHDHHWFHPCYARTPIVSRLQLQHRLTVGFPQIFQPPLAPFAHIAGFARSACFMRTSPCRPLLQTLKLTCRTRSSPWRRRLVRFPVPTRTGCPSLLPSLRSLAPPFQRYHLSRSSPGRYRFALLRRRSGARMAQSPLLALTRTSRKVTE